MWKIVGDFDSPLRVILFGISHTNLGTICIFSSFTYCALSHGACVKWDPPGEHGRASSYLGFEQGELFNRCALSLTHYWPGTKLCERTPTIYLNHDLAAGIVLLESKSTGIHVLCLIYWIVGGREYAKFSITLHVSKFSIMLDVARFSGIYKTTPLGCQLGCRLGAGYLETSYTVGSPVTRSTIT